MVVLVRVRASRLHLPANDRGGQALPFEGQAWSRVAVRIVSGWIGLINASRTWKLRLFLMTCVDLDSILDPTFQLQDPLIYTRFCLDSR